MKQSTKLLSLVLALVMAFSCMSVIANAALPNPHETEGAIAYDGIDDKIHTRSIVQLSNLLMSKNATQIYTNFPIAMVGYYMYNYFVNILLTNGRLPNEAFGRENQKGWHSHRN